MSIVAPSEQCVATKQNIIEPNTKYTHKSNDKMKMIILVRSDLKMGKGKTGAQCGHAAVGAYSSLLQSNNKSLLTQWESNGQAKICVRVENEQQLLDTIDTAYKLNIHTFIVRDAGHTQVAPDTLTCAAIGPAPESLIDQVTGKLKLLG